jgi:hypothetical protein
MKSTSERLKHWNCSGAETVSEEFNRQDENVVNDILDIDWKEDMLTRGVSPSRVAQYDSILRGMTREELINQVWKLEVFLYNE